MVTQGQEGGSFAELQGRRLVLLLSFFPQFKTYSNMKTSLNRRRLLARLYAEFDDLYYSPYLLVTVVARRTYGVRTCDRQMYLDIRHPEDVSTSRLLEIHDYIVSHDTFNN